MPLDTGLLQLASFRRFKLDEAACSNCNWTKSINQLKQPKICFIQLNHRNNKVPYHTVILEFNNVSSSSKF